MHNYTLMEIFSTFYFFTFSPFYDFLTAEIVAPDIEKTHYTVTFNDPGWAEAYAYLYGGGTHAADDAATWPGQKLTKTGDTYTFTYTAYAAPAYIIFNNGNGNGKQTPDLPFHSSFV